MQWAVVFFQMTGSEWSRFARLSPSAPFLSHIAGYSEDDERWWLISFNVFVDKILVTKFGNINYALIRPYVEPWPWQL